MCRHCPYRARVLTCLTASGSAHQALKAATAEALAWLEAKQSADKGEVDAQRKEVEDVAFPLLQKANQAASAGGAAEAGAAPPDDGPVEDGQGPTVEEVD